MKQNTLFVFLFIFSICAQAAPKNSQSKITAPVQKNIPSNNKWYRDLSAGVGLDVRREEQINKNDADYKVRYALHADRLWDTRWLTGLQYSYSQESSATGSLKVGQQNHELLLRGLARVYITPGGAFWAGLSTGYEKTRTQLAIENDNQTRWSDWSWVLAPEASFRHKITDNFWLQESLAYVVREYREEGEWSFALRLGMDFTNY